MKKSYTFVTALTFLALSNFGIAQNSMAFINYVSVADINSSFAIIDTTYSNGKSGAFPLYTHNYNPGGGFGIFQDYKQGLWYHSGKWRLYNQDNSDFEKNVYYNIFMPGNDTKSWSHKALAATISSNQTQLDDISINGDPNAIFFISDVLNGKINPNVIGVYYKTSNSRWYIFNEAGSGIPMVEDATFHVVIPNVNNTSFKTLALKADAQNTSGYKIEIDNPDLNGNPNATLIVTQVYNISGSLSGTYNNHNVGVHYTGTKWAIYNEDQATMPLGCGFNILYYANNNIGIKDNIFAKDDIKVYPNPVAANAKLTLSLSEVLEGEVIVKLYNLTGAVVLESSFENTSGASQNTVVMPNVVSGLYILEVTNKGKVGRQKLLIK